MNKQPLFVDISSFGPQYKNIEFPNTMTADDFAGLNIHRNEWSNRNKIHGTFTIGQHKMVFVSNSTDILRGNDRDMIPEDLKDIVCRNYSFFTLFGGEMQFPRDATPELWNYVRQHPKVLMYQPKMVSDPLIYHNNLVECCTNTNRIMEHIRRK